MSTEAPAVAGAPKSFTNARLRRVAAVQSSYIPWKGYFDLINSVDEFVLYDDAQFTRRDWRNRNRVKTPDGLRWLTIPVNSKGRFHCPVRSITVGDAGWPRRHWATIEAAYRRAPHFPDYGPRIRGLYETAPTQSLSAINAHFLSGLCAILGIHTRIAWSMDYRLEGDRTQRLVSLCRQTGATTYVSGPTARTYLDLAAFNAAGIDVSFFDYGGYPEYAQLHPPFDHHVSVVDLILHEGHRATAWMLSFGKEAARTCAYR